MVDDVPDFVTAKELDYHFQFVADSPVIVKLMGAEEGYTAAWVTVSSLPGLLRVLNTVPFPVLWPDIRLR